MRLWNTASSEIELVCAYIADDQTVANYFGISRQRVEHVRANMIVAVRKVHSGPERYGDDTKNGSTGLRAHAEAQEEAEMGSRVLNQGIQTLFRKWEREHGFQQGAAEILLPAGYVPQREAA